MNCDRSCGCASRDVTGRAHPADDGRRPKPPGVVRRRGATAAADSTLLEGGLIGKRRQVHDAEWSPIQEVVEGADGVDLIGPALRIVDNGISIGGDPLEDHDVAGPKGAPQGPVKTQQTLEAVARPTRPLVGRVALRHQRGDQAVVAGKLPELRKIGPPGRIQLQTLAVGVRAGGDALGAGCALMASRSD